MSSIERARRRPFASPPFQPDRTPLSPPTSPTHTPTSPTLAQPSLARAATPLAVALARSWVGWWARGGAGPLLSRRRPSLHHAPLCPLSSSRSLPSLVVSPSSSRRLLLLLLVVVVVVAARWHASALRRPGLPRAARLRSRWLVSSACSAPKHPPTHRAQSRAMMHSPSASSYLPGTCRVVFGLDFLR